MIQINYNLAEDTIALAFPVTVKPGPDSEQLVRVVFSSAPSVFGSLQFALSTDEADPSTLAFVEDFELVSTTTWEAVLNLNDARLIAFMVGEESEVVNIELVADVNSISRKPANEKLTVQAISLTGPGESDLGPEYQTQAQADGRYVSLVAQTLTDPQIAIVLDKLGLSIIGEEGLPDPDQVLHLGPDVHLGLTFDEVSGGAWFGIAGSYVNFEEAGGQFNITLVNGGSAGSIEIADEAGFVIRGGVVDGAAPITLLALQYILPNLPVSNPGMFGALWRSGNDVKVSTG